MKNFLVLLLTFFTCCNCTLALEIVYPKTNPVKISAPSTFFIGSANPQEHVKINNSEVKISPIGAFAQVVPLNIGKNNFKIISGEETIDFVIERPAPVNTCKKPAALIEYPPISFYVKKDNAPLRMTPVDSGINRMSHLPMNTQLLVDGEKGAFYRVYLNSKLTGWIAKSDVEQGQFPVQHVLVKSKIKEDNDFCKYEFEIQGKPPFTIKEENGLSLQIFNLQSSLVMQSPQQDVVDGTYCINIPIKNLFGYETIYDGDKFILKIRKTPKIKPEEPLKNTKITIDAGHGGNEFGAIGGCGDKEKDINLAIAKELHQELEKRGANVFMTRKDDSNVSLQDRVKFAHEKNSALLISIHANALPDGSDPMKNKGTSIYYYYNQAKPLAENILKEMNLQLGTQNDKVRQGSLALVRPTSSVSILIEVAYIINPDDYALLLDKHFQTKCAKAISDGIEKYILNISDCKDLEQN